jgi:hypothetical protein
MTANRIVSAAIKVITMVAIILNIKEFLRISFASTQSHDSPVALFPSAENKKPSGRNLTARN